MTATDTAPAAAETLTVPDDLTTKEAAALPKGDHYTRDGSRWSPPVLGVGHQIHVADPSVHRNADLVERAARLHWPAPAPDVNVIDLTSGRRNFWTPALFDAYRPTLNDADPDYDADFHYDYRVLPAAWSGMFHVVIYDPPYIAKGARVGHGYETMNAAYGLLDCPKTAAGLEVMNFAGLVEAARVCIPGGVIFVKYSDGVDSGNRLFQVRRMCNYAEEIGLVMVDEFDFQTPKARAQPPRRNKHGQWSVQQHAANNTSRLCVFQRPTRPRPNPGEQVLFA